MAVPSDVLETVLAKSESMPPDSVAVKGFDFNNGVDIHSLLSTYITTGFQATHFGRAVKEIEKMVIMISLLHYCNKFDLHVVGQEG